MNNYLYLNHYILSKINIPVLTEGRYIIRSITNEKSIIDYPTRKGMTDYPTRKGMTNYPIRKGMTGKGITDCPTGKDITDYPTGKDMTGKGITDYPIKKDITKKGITDCPTGKGMTGKGMTENNYHSDNFSKINIYSEGSKSVKSLLNLLSPFIASSRHENPNYYNLQIKPIVEFMLQSCVYEDVTINSPKFNEIFNHLKFILIQYMYHPNPYKYGVDLLFYNFKHEKVQLCTNNNCINSAMFRASVSACIHVQLNVTVIDTDTFYAYLN